MEEDLKDQRLGSLNVSKNNFEKLDSLTFELFELLSIYENIINVKVKKTISDGFINISEANYTTSSSFNKFNILSVDFRPCKSTIKIIYCSIRKQFKLINFLKENDTIKMEDDENENIYNFDENINTLRKRTIKVKQDNNCKTENFDDNKIQNPINQFGVIVPYELKLAQDFFLKFLRSCVSLTNLQQKILHLITEIKYLKTSINKI